MCARSRTHVAVLCAPRTTSVQTGRSHCQSHDYFCWLYLLTFLELKSFFACSCAKKYYIYIDDLYKQSVLLDDACTQFPVFPQAIFLKLKSIFRLKKSGC